MKAKLPALDLLFPRVRAEILRLLFFNPKNQRYVRELMTMSGLALRTVQEELAILTALGLVISWSNGYHRFYRANRAHPLLSFARYRPNKCPFTASNRATPPDAAKAKTIDRDRFTQSKPFPYPSLEALWKLDWINQSSFNRRVIRQRFAGKLVRILDAITCAPDQKIPGVGDGLVKLPFWPPRCPPPRCLCG
jgi:hypothetical protein